MLWYTPDTAAKAATTGISSEIVVVHRPTAIKYSQANDRHSEWLSPPIALCSFRAVQPAISRFPKRPKPQAPRDLTVLST
jgi:hypothetical protein